MTKVLKVFIIDDEEKRKKAITRIWEQILSRTGLEFKISFFDNFPEAQESMNERPHLAIVDNVMVDEDEDELDNEGLNFISKFKNPESDSIHADTLYYLVTGASFNIEALSNHTPNPDLIVTKTNLSNETYQKYLAKRIRQQLKRLPIGDILFPDAEDDLKVESFKNELSSILEQCLKSFHSEFIDLRKNRMSLTSMTGGYSGSYVFKIENASLSNIKLMPLAFKISNSDYIKEEVDKYNAFLRLNLPHDMRVDLIGYGRAGSYSGVLYAFAFGDADGMVNATSCIEEKDLDAINLISRRLFGKDDIGWYNSRLNSKTIESFFQNSSEYDLLKDPLRTKNQIKNFKRLFPEEKIKIDASVQIGPKSFIGIRKLLSRKGMHQIPLTICHGDLNTNNIFINSSKTSISMIDFEYSGEDWCYKDLVSLETSTRVFWGGKSMSSENFWDIFETEVDLFIKIKSHNFEDVGKYFTPIQKLRHSAMSMDRNKVDDTSYRAYMFGYAFHCLKLLGMTHWTQDQLCRLGASYLASLSVLEGLT